jgi:4-amino-4-deoxy-L-arabinose transferase-like glycosyltransferase
LSSPFVAAGYIEAGRLISLIAAVAAALLVSYTAAEVAGETAGLLAPAALWCHPYFIRSAYGFIPETLSIALTVGAIACTLRYTKTNNERWWYGSVIVLCIAVTNHMWEAVVLLPIVALLIYNGKIYYASITAILTVLTVLVVRKIVSQQPRLTGLSQYTVFSDGVHIIFSADWLFRGSSFNSVFQRSYAILLPAALILCGVWIAIFVKKRRQLPLLMSTWLLSGISIPVLMAKGQTVHSYYEWAVYAPIAISVAIGLSAIINRAVTITSIKKTALMGACIVILLTPMAGFVIIEQEFVNSSPRDATSEDIDFVTEEIRESDINSVEDLTIQGDWTSYGTMRSSGISRMLVYSELSTKNTWIFRQSEPGAPTILTLNEPAPDRCELLIKKSDNGEWSVSEC